MAPDTVTAFATSIAAIVLIYRAWTGRPSSSVFGYRILRASLKDTDPGHWVRGHRQAAPSLVAGKVCELGRTSVTIDHPQEGIQHY